MRSQEIAAGFLRAVGVLLIAAWLVGRPENGSGVIS
jgi:hypothetical protein